MDFVLRLQRTPLCESSSRIAPQDEKEELLTTDEVSPLWGGILDQSGDRPLLRLGEGEIVFTVTYRYLIKVSRRQSEKNEDGGN